MKELVTERFWSSIRQGDSNAYALMYDEYSDMLYNYGYRITPNSDLVSNAIQSLFIYIYDKRKNIEKPNHISAYLCVSLRRLILKELNDARSSKVISFDGEVENSDFEMEIDIENSIIKSETDKETIDAFDTALSELSGQQKEVIYLKYYKGLSNDEIAEIIGSSNQVVRNIASRALGRLRQSDALIKLIAAGCIIILLYLLLF